MLGVESATIDQNDQNDPNKTSIAIIGSGISCWGAAVFLASTLNYQVTIYEAESDLGGHTKTIKIPHPVYGNNQTHPVDVGFIVCNTRTYPNFINFLNFLNVKIDKSNMSFSVKNGIFEWAGRDLFTFFGGGNINNLKMWKMAYEIIRFNLQATAIAEESDEISLGNGENQGSKYSKMNLKQFLEEEKYSEFFKDNYLVPMTAAIWSTPAELIFEQFPILTLVRFMRNHGLLQIGKRPQWLTINGGSKTYIDKIIENYGDKLNIKLNHRVEKVLKYDDHVEIFVNDKIERHDYVIFATHADTAKEILEEGNISDEELRILSKFQFVKNNVVLHRDEKLMPRNRLKWSSWNYRTVPWSRILSLTYWMNLLQNIDSNEWGNVFVTVNPEKPTKDIKDVLGIYEMDHPLYNLEMIQAQDELYKIQRGRIRFAGAWTNFGFHEDGLTSSLLAALSLSSNNPLKKSIILNGGYPSQRKILEIPKLNQKWISQNNLLNNNNNQNSLAITKWKFFHNWESTIFYFLNKINISLQHLQDKSGIDIFGWIQRILIFGIDITVQLVEFVKIGMDNIIEKWNFDSKKI